MLKCTWRLYETQKQLPENTAPCRAPAPPASHYEAQHTCAARSAGPSPRALLFFLQPMPPLLCLPGERTPCEREEMRCKGQRVPIRATPPSPICAQFMPLCCCGLRGSPPAATASRKKAIFQSAPVPSLSLSVPPLPLVKQNSDTTL